MNTILIPVSILSVLSCLFAAAGLVGAHAEIGIDETVDIAVQDRAGVRGLLLGAGVLDQGVGLQDVGADLAAPGNVLDLAADITTTPEGK